MIEKIEVKTCDICKQEVKDFAGSLILRYSGPYWYSRTNIAYPEICIDCARKLEDCISKALGGIVCSAG